VARRVSPVERIRAEIDQLFSSDHDLALILEEVARLSVRLVLQTALEAEVEEFLGRARYERRGDGDRPGSRNGHQPPMTVKTTMGAVALQRPKLRGTDQAFCSRLFGAGVTRTNALESLVISGWVRGLSDRDIEATLAEVLGPEAALSKSTVSRICAAIGEEFAAWRARDLSGVRLDYLFLDASHFKMHPGAPAEPVLAAWASMSTASRCSWAWRQQPRSPPTPGTTSSPTSRSVAWVRRCWGSATAPPGSSAPLTGRSRPACASGAWSIEPATPSPRSPPMTSPR
jgi:putative transposase